MTAEEKKIYFYFLDELYKTKSYGKVLDDEDRPIYVWWDENGELLFYYDHHPIIEVDGVLLLRNTFQLERGEWIRIVLQWIRQRKEFKHIDIDDWYSFNSTDPEKDFLRKDNEKRIDETIDQSENQKQKKIKLIDNLLKTFCPDFNKEGVIVSRTRFTRGGSAGLLEVFADKDTLETYAYYDHEDYQIQLTMDIYETLQSYLDDDTMDYFVDWFNQEFNKDAEYFTV